MTTPANSQSSSEFDLSGLAVTRGLHRVKGVTLTALSEFLGCTPATVKKLLTGEAPVDEQYIAGNVYPLYDPGIVERLIGHPEVEKSKRRRTTRMGPRKRQALLAAYVSSWLTEGAELVGLIIQAYKSIRDVQLPLGPCTILIGPNSAGKTNLLEAIAGAGGRWDLAERMRGRPPSDKDVTALRMGAVYRLPAQDEAGLREFLDAFLFRIDPPAYQSLNQVLNALLGRPLVVTWAGRQGDVAWGTRQADLAVDRDAAKVLAHHCTATSLEDLRDPWLSNVVSNLLDATSPFAVVESLPSHLSIRPHRMAAVEGDPVTLQKDLEEVISNALGGQDETAVGDRLANLTIEDEMPSDLPHEVPWVEWIEAPTSIHHPRELIGRATKRDPSIRVGQPSGRAQWLTLGFGSVTPENITEAARVSDRESVLDLWKRVIRLYAAWHGRDEETSDQSALWSKNLLPFGALGVYDTLGLGGAGDTWDRWLQPHFDRAVLRDDVRDLLARVEEEANELAPPFVRHQGRIALNVLPVHAWRTAEHRIQVRFISEARTLDLAEVGKGAQRWVAASIREAARRLVTLTAAPTAALGQDANQARPIPKPSLLLIDEPELALHPEAQDQAAHWCVQAGRLGQVVVAASHSPSMLDLPAADARILHVRMVNGETVAEPIEVQALVGLDELANSLGLGRSGLLHLARGFVLLEGPADVEVIKELLGRQLRQQRIIPIPLHGAKQVKALLQAEFLAAIGKPVAIMLDDVQRNFVDGDAEPRTNEERFLVQVRDFVSAFSVRVIAFEAPDIIAALPETAVRRVTARFTSWPALMGTWDRGTESFKHHVLDGLQWEQKDARGFIRAVLEKLDPGDEPPPVFKRAAEELLAWAESISHDGSFLGS